VACDIAPLGIAVARAAGLRSVLVENFTWDWIYEGYQHDYAGLTPHIDYLGECSAQADYRIQTEPVCRYVEADLVTAPASRAPRTAGHLVREQLGVPPGASLVLVTMGGLSASSRHTFLDRLNGHAEVYFVVPGATDVLQVCGNTVLLPFHSSFYHPDVMYAADAIVGKTGYSTVAEAYQAGVPYGFVSRPKFPESDVMATYIHEHMRGMEFSEAEFGSGAWLDRLPALLALGRIPRGEVNGAEQVAQFVREL
jgi:hypothetical protein